jgi:poly-gamma-glutamate synthesis protein (capsule biosynthesis protein)
MTRLGFTGDVMLGRLVDEHQRQRAVDAVWGDVLDRLRALDGLFVNLECCLSAGGAPWTKTYRPFHFRADPDWAVPALEAAGVDYVSLANNHVLDYRAAALRDTLDHLDDAGIAHAGAGENETAAREPAVIEVDGLEVAVVSFTDNTPEYAAAATAPGTAHVEFDAGSEATRRVVGRAITRARERDPDLLVASLHWGPNMRTEPSDAFRGFARWLADVDVDLVHGHSAHVFQGVEVVDETLVLYDTGDFVDDYAVDDALRNDRGFLFELDVDDGDLSELRLLPTEIDDYAVHRAGPTAADWTRERMCDLSNRFGTEFERDDEELVLAL